MIKVMSISNSLDIATNYRNACYRKGAYNQQSDVPVLVAVVRATGGYGAQLLAVAAEGLRGELVLYRERHTH